MTNQPDDTPAASDAAAGETDQAIVSDLGQIVERLRWTPKQPLDYLVEMVAFEKRAHRARRIV